ncbi:MAG: hypothetical protein U0174_01225 [Polyangiaceae bacterium]
MAQSPVPDFFDLVERGDLLPQDAITALRDFGLKGADNDLTALVRRGIAEAAGKGVDLRGGPLAMASGGRLAVDAPELRAGGALSNAMAAAHDLYQVGLRNQWWR